MLATELLVLIVSVAIVHYLSKIVRKILADEAFDIHFFDDLGFNRKITTDQDTLIYNVMYIVSVLFTLILRIVVPFYSFYWYSWYHLFAFIQTFLIVAHTRMSLIEKGSICGLLVVYYCIPSGHLDNLLFFSVCSMDPIVITDVQLFGEHAMLKHYHKKLLQFDTAVLFIFWTISLYSFVRTPFIVDTVTIPVSFYHLLYQKKKRRLQYKKHV